MYTFAVKPLVGEIYARHMERVVVAIVRPLGNSVGASSSSIYKGNKAGTIDRNWMSPALARSRLKIITKCARI